MSKKALLLVSVLALSLMLGAVSAFADDGGNLSAYVTDDGETVYGYADGRINATDIIQSVAVYYSHETVVGWDDDTESATYGEVISGIELWALDSDDVGQQVLSVSLDQITPALSSSVDVQVAAANGYTVNYSPSGYFWVTAPDGYTFIWEAF